MESETFPRHVPRAAGRLIAVLVGTLLLGPGAARGVINGSDDTTGAYGAVAAFGSGCSSVMVAPRVMLTSAHCLPAHALSCTNLAMNPLVVTFAEGDGGWSSQASLMARTVNVQQIVLPPAIFDLSTCAPGDTYNCMNAARQAIDHSRELVVMYLAADAPPDVQPLPILVHPGVDATDSAAEVGVFTTLEAWGQGQPVVTTVGYGVGSHQETVGGAMLRGRDYGLQVFADDETDFAGFLGAANCSSLTASGNRPGVKVSPADLTFAQIGDPSVVVPGTDYLDIAHSHSGGGDSGGPVLFGTGIGAKGDAPTAYSGPGAGVVYDPDRNYVAGTASIWVEHGGKPATAFNPTWTQSASAFLMDALHDSDGDDYADPVDGDRDGDGCDNDVDQNPDDRWVQVGVTFRPNCSPSSVPRYGDESLDSDLDTVPNCRDTDDDNDGIPDAQDSCPIQPGNFCVDFGGTCPWNPVFFDCRSAGCGELLVKLSSLINPDPTRDLVLQVLSVEEQVVTVAPARDLSVRRTASLLARAGAWPGGDSAVLALEVVGSHGRFGPDTFGGMLAVFSPRRVRTGELSDDHNALRLRIGRDGASLEITGARVTMPNR